LGFGGFRVWGFNVGFIGTHFLWVASCVVAAKYGALMCGAVAYLFMLLKYIDESAPVFQSELMSAAQARSPELYSYFESNPEGLRSVTDTLNAGIDGLEQNREKVIRKLMERLKRELIAGLVGGALFFGLLAMVI